MVTDAEIIALVDAVAAAQKDATRAKTRLANAHADLTAAQEKVTTRQGELEVANAAVKTARQLLNEAIDSRVLP